MFAFRGFFCPPCGAVFAPASIENHRRTSRSRAENVQSASANIDGTSDLRQPSPKFGATNAFVNKSANNDGDERKRQRLCSFFQPPERHTDCLSLLATSRLQRCAQRAPNLLPRQETSKSGDE